VNVQVAEIQYLKNKKIIKAENRNASGLQQKQGRSVTDCTQNSSGM
jgi:hypothetical protein